MRGSSLAHPEVVKTLRPFIVTSWNGRGAKDMPADVREVFEAAGFRQPQVNIALLVLDSQGRLQRAVTPQIRPGQLPDPESRGRDFLRQLQQLLAGMSLPAVPPRKELTLPDVSGRGVRIYLTFSKNRLHHFRTPVVDAIALSEVTREALKYPAAAREVPISALRPWLQQIYPPAVMDGLGGFKHIGGQLTLEPAGANAASRFAILKGDVQFVLDNRVETRYQGKLQVVLGYGPNSAEVQTIRGICECTFPRQDPQGRVVESVTMTAAIESRPK